MASPLHDDARRGRAAAVDDLPHHRRRLVKVDRVVKQHHGGHHRAAVSRAPLHLSIVSLRFSVGLLNWFLGQKE